MALGPNPIASHLVLSPFNVKVTVVGLVSILIVVFGQPKPIVAVVKPWPKAIFIVLIVNINKINVFS